MGRQRVAGDYLQPAAIFDRRFRVQSGVNQPNDYSGPGTGYRLDGERWREVQALHQVQSPRDFIADRIGVPVAQLPELGVAQRGAAPEVIVAVGPAFGTELTQTIGGLAHEDVLAAILTGIAREGQTARIVKVYHSSDLAAISHAGTELSGSGIAVGLQSRGTTIIQRKGLARLNNLELFPQSPSLTLEIYESIGRNAALYAKGEPTKPIPVQVDNWARLRLIVKTTLLHRRETEQIRDQLPTELYFDWEPDV